ncbi:MAG: LPS export ABC transporter periplasmic protein LptC [Melioribacteraceae bacterium]|nr:LPS export ABC transporter periplasmic protein LptC [Melioribacteraceae bacterium]
MKNKFLILIILLFLPAIIFSQDRGNLVVIGDSLIGKVIDGENVREVIGNVIMTQDEVRITCDRAVQFIKQNEAELIGNVVVTQDTIRIKTSRGFYNGNKMIAYSTNGITLTDGHYHLNSKIGYYYFEENRSFFTGNVNLYDNETEMTSDTLYYFDNENKSIGKGNVKVNSKNSVLIADSLINYRDTEITFAYENVVIADKKESMLILSDYLEDNKKAGSSKIEGNPLLVQVDTLDNGSLDTLYIKSVSMESFKDSSKNVLIAKDSVNIFSKNLNSINSETYFDQIRGEIRFKKKVEDTAQPILWYSNSQLSGDSINIKLIDKKLKDIKVFENSMLVSRNEKYPERYEQISGDSLFLFFMNDTLNNVEVTGKILSIYYLYDNGEGNGVLKSSGERMRIGFEDGSVGEVKLYGSPATEYYPDQKIVGNERDFLLPTFNLFDRPIKKIFERKIPFNLLEEKK